MTQVLDAQALAQLFDPLRYLGATARVHRARSGRTSRAPDQLLNEGLHEDLSCQLPGSPTLRSTTRSTAMRAAPPLLLSNSLGTSLEMWEPQIAALAGRFRVIRYDSRGHGQSTVTPGPYTIEQVASDALGLLDALAVAARAFLRLVDGRHGRHVARHPRAAADRPAGARQHRGEDRHGGNVERAHRRCAQGRHDVDRLGRARALVLVAAARGAHADHREDAHDARSACRPKATRHRARRYATWTSATCVGRIRAPTLVIAGTEDFATPADDGRFVAEHVPNARYVELPAAHLSNVQAAPAFTQALMQFLTGRTE